MKNFYNRGRNFSQKHFYTINSSIVAKELRVVDKEGKQIGVLTREKALQVADEKESDLILIAPNASPPVAKIIDFKKFLYQEQKKQKEAKKGVKKSTTKDLKLSLFIAEADLNRLIERGKEFLNAGNQLRLNLTLKGREMGKKDIAMSLVYKFIHSLGDLNISKEPRIEGRVIRAVVAKKK